MTPVEMTHMIEEINELTDSEHAQIFQIVQQHSCRYTENLNGVFLNLVHLPVEVLSKIKDLLVFWKDQQELFDATAQEAMMNKLETPLELSADETVVHRGANGGARSVKQQPPERQTIFNEATSVSQSLTKEAIGVICGNKDKRTKLTLNNQAKQHLIQSGGSALRVAKKCIASEDDSKR